MSIYTDIKPEDSYIFESLKTHIVDESTLGSLMSEPCYGKLNTMYGYVWGDRYPKPMLGKKHSEETKRNWSIKRKGIKPPNTGIPHTDETKQKMSAVKLGKSRPDIAESNKKRTGIKYKKRVKTPLSHPTEDDICSQ